MVIVAIRYIYYLKLFNMEQEMEVSVPPYFLCPISLQIMKDPVIVPTGITYDRDSIEKWVYTNKNTTCPVTKQALIINQDSDFLTPNHTLRRFIQSWSTLNASYGIERFPTPKPPASKTQIKKLIDEAANHPGQTRSRCLKRLRSIASGSTANKRCLESAGAVEFLSRVVLAEGSGSDEALGILSLLRISGERLKGLMLEEREGELVAALVRVMQGSSYDVRDNAIVFMKSIMQAAEPAQVAKLKLELGHFAEVVQVLRDQVSLKAARAALKVLALALPWGRNRVRAVEAAAVPVLLDLLFSGTPTEDRRSSEMALTVLDQLCGSAEGRAALLEHGAGLAIVSRKILRVSHYATDRGVRILSSISRFSASLAVLREMVEVGAVTKLCMVLQTECEANTKERAREIMKLHGRAWGNSPCAPLDVLASLP